MKPVTSPYNFLNTLVSQQPLYSSAPFHHSFKFAFHCQSFLFIIFMPKIFFHVYLAVSSVYLYACIFIKYERVTVCCISVQRVYVNCWYLLMKFLMQKLLVNTRAPWDKVKASKKSSKAGEFCLLILSCVLEGFPCFKYLVLVAFYCCLNLIFLCFHFSFCFAFMFHIFRTQTIFVYFFI